MRTPLFAILTVAALATAAGCNKDATKTPAGTAAATPPPAAAAQAPGTPAAQPGAPPAVKPVAAELPEVVATVNGEPVKRDELQMAIRNLEGRAGGAVPPEQRDAVYRQVLDRIVGYRLLVQEARARKVTAPPWEVDKRLSEIKQQFPNEQAFNDMMQQRGMSVDRLRQETSETIALNTMLEKEFESLVATSDADVRKFYDENKPRFREAEAVHASHILLRLEQSADAAAKAKTRTQLEGILAQAKKGADFAELAKKHSQDPGSAPKGGDLGFFTRGQMVPAFDEVAFTTKAGQVSGIVETPFGLHVIKVIEARPAREVSFDEAKEQIREYLKQQLREQKSQSFIEQLKAKGKIQIAI